MYREKWNKQCRYKKGIFSCYKPAIIGTGYCSLHSRRNDRKPQELIGGCMEKMTKEKIQARQSISTPYLLEGEENLYTTDLDALEQQIKLLNAIIHRLAKKKVQLDIDNDLELVEITSDSGRQIIRKSIESIDERLIKYTEALRKAIAAKREITESITPQEYVNNIVEILKATPITPIQCDVCS